MADTKKAFIFKIVFKKRSNHSQQTKIAKTAKISRNEVFSNKQISSRGLIEYGRIILSKQMTMILYETKINSNIVQTICWNKGRSTDTTSQILPLVCPEFSVIIETTGHFFSCTIGKKFVRGTLKMLEKCKQYLNQCLVSLLMLI